MKLGRFTLLHRIGAGGMGEVFAAVAGGEDGFERPWAVKRLLPSLSRDASFVRAFVAEARLAVRLHHPGIVQVFELDRAGDEHYLAMELVSGVDLQRLGATLRRKRQRLDVGLGCYLGIELAAALHYAHQLTDENGRPLGLVHRDVTPGNVMVGATGFVKLLDFGIAKATERIADERTRTGIIKGKAGYLSPEQADGRAIDRRSDLFSLGVMLTELLTARRLFAGSELLDSLRRVREAKLPDGLLDELPDQVAEVLRRLLARAPQDRYAGGAEVVDALTPAVHRFQGDGPALGRFVVGVELDEAPLPAPATPVARPRRRWPW